MPEARCEPRLETDLASAGLLWGLFPAPRSAAVDPSFSLDPTYEQPFMKDVLRRFPEQSAFLWPQAPFESATDDLGKSSRRWVDFLFAPPDDRPVVFEIDGSQHGRAASVDRERDDALAELQITTLRANGAKSLASDGPLFASISRAGQPAVNHAVVDAVRGPIDATRAVYGIIEAVAVGLLRPGRAWRVLADCGSEATLLATLDACAALDHVWSTGVMPATIELVGVRERTWANPFVSVTTSESADEATVVVEWAPAWAPIEQPDDAAGVVVVRGVPLPVHAGWDVELSSERRPRESGAFPSDVEGHFFATEALEVLARLCFGVDAFRSGQVNAIRQILSGEDACVLLPTGHGKTLVYQVALLLRPGLTLVVAPIVALIDDQQKRFVAEGIDRVAAVQAARTDDPKEGDVLYGSIASGNAMICLLSPERMQIERFREQLRHVAERRLVSLAVVDETHCVSEWGHDFRTSYLRLGRNIRELCKGDDDVPPPLLSLTGTASPGVLRDVLGELKIDGNRPGALQQPESFDRANLHYGIVACSEEQEFETLRQVILEDIPAALGVDGRDLAELRGADTVSGIVFVPWTRSTHGTEAVARAVKKFFEDARLPVPGVGTYSGRNPHADGDRFDSAWASQKAETAEKFKTNKLNILVATKAFGMGIDKPNIRWTVHLGIPSSIEAFAQEAGPCWAQQGSGAVHDRLCAVRSETDTVATGPSAIRSRATTRVQSSGPSG